MAPTAVDASPPHHGLTAGAALILLAGAAVLLTPMLLASNRDLDQSTPVGISRSTSKPFIAPLRGAGAPGQPKEEVDAPTFEQFVQLPGVVITSTEEKVDVAENTPAPGGEQETVRTARAIGR